MQSTDTQSLQRTAHRSAKELGPNATAQELIRWAHETFPGKFLIASNMQDAVLIDVAVKAIGAENVTVLFLDTGYHFAETIGTRDAIETAYGVHVIDVEPQHDVASQDRLMGTDLFSTNPGECCRVRKVVPLKKALEPWDAWVTGIRRVESPTRAHAPLISYDDGFGLVKINPLAAWSDDDVNAYIQSHGVLVNPLVDEGYPSIGCFPCTQKPLPGADPRSGRWAGQSKTECGLHTT